MFKGPAWIGYSGILASLPLNRASASRYDTTHRKAVWHNEANSAFNYDLTVASRELWMPRYNYFETP